MVVSSKRVVGAMGRRRFAQSENRAAIPSTLRLGRFYAKTLEFIPSCLLQPIQLACLLLAFRDRKT